MAIRLAFPTGRAHAQNDNLALLPLVFELLNLGTESRSAIEIADTLDQNAISFETSVQLEYSVITMTALRSRLQLALEILSDMLRNPVFPEEELEKVKTRWRSHLVAQRSQPRFLAKERLYRTLFGGHPYERTTPTLEQLNRSERRDLIETFERHVLPSGTFLLLAGSISHAEAESLIADTLGAWTGGPIPNAAFGSILPEPGRSVSLVHRPDSQQAGLHVARLTIPKGHPDGVDLEVANQVLGGGGSARLFLNLREEKGYTYGVYSSLRSLREAGLQTISTDVGNGVVQDSIEIILEEMKKMSEAPPRPEELERGQAELYGRFLFQMETPLSIGLLELSRVLYDLPESYYQDFVPKVKRVTGRDVQKSSRTYIRPESSSIVVVGDRSLAEQLTLFGPVSVFDTDGQPIESAEE